MTDFTAQPVPASNGTMDEKDRHMKRILAHVDAELENDPVLCPSRQHAVDTVREPALRALHCILVTTTVRWNRRYPDENLVTVEGVHCRGRSTALVASADGASDHSWRGKPAQMHPTKAMLQHLTTDAPSAMYFRGVVLRDRDIDELIEIHGDTVVIVFDLFLPSLLTGDAFRWCLQCFGNDAFAYAMPHTQRGRPNATKLRICMTERSLLVACKTIAAMLSIPTPKTSMPPAIQRVEYEPQDDIRHHLESLRVPLSVAQTERIRAAWYAITVLHADDSLHDATLSMLQSHSGRHVWILLENVSGFCVNFMNAVWNATFTEKDAASEKLIEPENTRFKVHPEATNPDDDTVGFSLRFLVLSTTHQNKRARQDSDVTDPTEQELPTNKRACNSNTAVAATEG